MVGDCRHRQGAGQRQPAGTYRFDGDDLAGQCGFHVHDTVAVDGAIYQVTRERPRPLPAMRLGLGVHVAGEHHPGARPQAYLRDGIGAPGEHRFQCHRLESGVPHDIGEEGGQVSLLTENARNAAHLPHQVHRPVQVQALQHRGCETRINGPHGHANSSNCCYVELPARPRLATGSPAAAGRSMRSVAATSHGTALVPFAAAMRPATVSRNTANTCRS